MFHRSRLTANANQPPSEYVLLASERPRESGWSSASPRKLTRKSLSSLIEGWNFEVISICGKPHTKLKKGIATFSSGASLHYQSVEVEFVIRCPKDHGE